LGIDVNIRITVRAGQGVLIAGGILSRLAVAAGPTLTATQD
jgi:Pyruvate/2-oxoacid:ferredoxin oxidoreductase gamma subunit